MNLIKMHDRIELESFIVHDRLILNNFFISYLAKTSPFVTKRAAIIQNVTPIFVSKALVP